MSAVSAAPREIPQSMVETRSDPGATSARTILAGPVPQPTRAAAPSPQFEAGVPAVATPSPAAPSPAAVPGRPEPTRSAVLTAFQSAARPAASDAPALAPAAPAAARPGPPPIAITPMSPIAPATLARVQTSSAPSHERSTQPPSAAPDLEALAEYVLERLRGELRDGRERLGFLLDDSL